jgi:hypothetical protein
MVDVRRIDVVDAVVDGVVKHGSGSRVVNLARLTLTMLVVKNRQTHGAKAER